jgi:hypothetical protein
MPELAAHLIGFSPKSGDASCSTTRSARPLEGVMLKKGVDARRAPADERARSSTRRIGLLRRISPGSRARSPSDAPAIREEVAAVKAWVGETSNTSSTT